MTTDEVSTSTPRTASDWSRFVKESIETRGLWETYDELQDRIAREPSPELLGYAEVVRTTIVRRFLEKSDQMKAVPRISPQFLSDFDRFNLNVQEGFLMSLIDGRSSLQAVLKLSPFDHFTTLFNLAKLHHQKAITLPS
ncbi:MAG: hypothetical protein R3338_02350 [Thermoanaerobaculia bacterium]|nr:hypothetical protein [Thermoanaerobaculia bacterium]